LLLLQWGNNEITWIKKKLSKFLNTVNINLIGIKTVCFFLCSFHKKKTTWATNIINIKVCQLTSQAANIYKVCKIIAYYKEILLLQKKSKAKIDEKENKKILQQGWFLLFSLLCFIFFFFLISVKLKNYVNTLWD